MNYIIITLQKYSNNFYHRAFNFVIKFKKIGISFTAFYTNLTKNIRKSRISKLNTKFRIKNNTEGKAHILQEVQVPHITNEWLIHIKSK